MAKGVFPSFMRRMSRDLTARWPGIRAIDRPYGRWLRKSNTLDAGRANPHRMHLLVHFQPSTKPWGGGDFTVNLVLTRKLDGDPPLFSAAIEGFARGGEGSYRIGNVLYGRDKWWSLTENDNIHGLSWKARSYASQEAVFSEASGDVIRDLAGACERLGHEPGKMAAQQRDAPDEVREDNGRRGPRR